jgi:hypothetical protein
MRLKALSPSKVIPAGRTKRSKRGGSRRAAMKIQIDCGKRSKIIDGEKKTSITTAIGTASVSMWTMDSSADNLSLLTIPTAAKCF